MLTKRQHLLKVKMQNIVICIINTQQFDILLKNTRKFDKLKIYVILNIGSGDVDEAFYKMAWWERKRSKNYF